MGRGFLRFWRDFRDVYRGCDSPAGGCVAAGQSGVWIGCHFAAVVLGAGDGGLGLTFVLKCDIIGGMELNGTAEPITLVYDVDYDHVAVCDKPLAGCPVCAEAFGVVCYPAE